MTKEKKEIKECQKTEEQQITIELIKWKHFFEIARRPIIWIPLVIIQMYIAESKPLGMIPFFMKIISVILGIDK